MKTVIKLLKTTYILVTENGFFVLKGLNMIF